MSKLVTKFVSTALVATAVVWTFGAYVPAAQGQTVAELQALVNSLLAQIQALNAQISAIQGGTPGAGVVCSFTSDLTIGSEGADVKCLQQYLNAAGFTVATSGAGSPGNETEYFGPRTQQAVAAWQAANGVTPSVGYFGPISRAKYSSLLSQQPPIQPPPIQPPPDGQQLIPASGLMVSTAPENATPGSIISGTTSAARVPVLTVNLTAGAAGGITVNDLKFTRGGVLSDNSISSAYLIENGKVLAQFSSLSGGVITFNGLNLGVNAGQTRKLVFAIDPANGLSAGNTVSFRLASASDVMAVDNTGTAVAVSGTFPIQGATYTVTTVSSPAIASLVVSSSSVGTSVYAGDQNVLVSQWTLTGSNSPVDLKGLTFRVIGSANKSDIKNVKLFVNGTQVGPTLAQVAADGSAHFDLSSNPARINTGSSNLQVYADITGSPSFTFAFQLLNSFDVLAVDTQYNVPVSVTVNGGSGVTVTIQQGTLTVSLASDTPTGNIAKGGSGVALAKFKIYAAGEQVKVKFLDFKLAFTGTTTTLSSMIKNIVLVDDVGQQVGATINTPPSTAACEGDATPGLDGLNYIDCFGTSASNINYIIPANTTRVLTLRGDIQSTATFSTITASLIGNTSNLQGMTSSQIASSGAVTGSILSLAANSLTVSKNSGVGSQTYSAGAGGARIGSYALTASSAEGVNLTSITIKTGTNGASYQNLRVMRGTTQFGTTQPTVGANTSYTFSGSVNIPAGQTVIVDVYADILSGTSAGTHSTITTLTGCSGSGASTFTSVSCSSTAGQDVVIAGQSSITVTANSSQTPASQIVMTNDNLPVPLAGFRFTETSNIEDVKITDLVVFQQVAATSTVKSAFSNLQLYNGTELLGSAGSATTYSSTSNPGPGYYYTFSFGTPVVVPRASSIDLTLKGDVASYSSSGATDNTTHVFKIAVLGDNTSYDTAAEVVTALGNTSNATSSVTISSANGNAQTILRSKLGFSASSLGSTSGRVKQVSDNLASLTFTADAAGTVAVNTVIVTFSGSAPSVATFLDGVVLLDENGQELGTGNTTSSMCTGGTSTCTKTFNLGVTTSGETIGAGQSRTWTLKIDSTKTLAGSATTVQTLNAVINARTDILFTDALDTAAVSAIGLPQNVVVPIQLNAVSFAEGT